jgi:hypothetical protein
MPSGTIISYLSLRLAVGSGFLDTYRNFRQESTKDDFRIADDSRIDLGRLPKLGPDTDKGDVEYFFMTAMRDHLG